MTITATETGTGTVEPLDADTSHRILIRAANECLQDTVEALAAARELGDENAISICSTERRRFTDLVIALRTPAHGSAAF